MDFKFDVFEDQLEKAVGGFADELSRIKGWSFNSVKDVMGKIMVAVPILVPMWAMAGGDDRKKALIKAINKHIDIPFIPEYIEGMAFGWLYDILAKVIFKGL